MSRKIDALLDKLEKNANLTRTGRDWLIASCDPFHDSDISLGGYPDVLTASTVVQLVKQQIQITVPGTVTAGANWDCSITLMPNLCATTLNYVNAINQTGSVTSATGVTSITLGGLTVQAGAQGSNLYFQSNGTLTGATSTTLNPTAYVKGQGRVIGMGFEVVNTTATLYKQGQVTCWRQPSANTRSTFQYSTATTPIVYSQVGVDVNRMPPANIAACQLLYGSRSWDAAEGAYVVSRQNTDSNPAYLPQCRTIGYTTLDGLAGPTINPADYVYTQDPLGGPTALAIYDYNCPFDQSGAFFTGLSYTTSLTINVRWLFERIPCPLESDLVVLATPSAPYDPLALELYCRCLGDMPPGVMLKENPLGEWFSNALAKVADWAPKIGSALGTIIPGAGMLGNVVGMISGKASSMLAPEAKNQEVQVVPIQRPIKNRKKQLPRVNTVSRVDVSRRKIQSLPSSRSYAVITPQR